MIALSKFITYDCVKNSSDNSDTNQPKSHLHARLAQNVEERRNEEGRNVFKVIQVPTTHTLDFLVFLDLDSRAHHVFGVFDCLFRQEIKNKLITYVQVWLNLFLTPDLNRWIAVNNAIRSILMMRIPPHVIYPRSNSLSTLRMWMLVAILFYLNSKLFCRRF